MTRAGRPLSTKPDANVLQAARFQFCICFLHQQLYQQIPRFTSSSMPRMPSWAGLYLKGVMENGYSEGEKMYPDATFTMRVSYGKVKSYRPGMPFDYDYVTTSKGYWKNIYRATTSLTSAEGPDRTAEKKDLASTWTKAARTW